MNSALLEKIFKGVTIPYDLGPVECDEWSNAIADFAKQFSEEVEFQNGVSKCALIVKDAEEVIKVPFNGFFDYDDEETFVPFERANDVKDNTATNWDYCKNELIKYEQAVSAGFGEFFAYTEYCKDIDGTPVYAQEKCITISWGGTPKTAISDHASKVFDSNYHYNYERLNSDWVCAAIDWYGEKKTLDFIYYLGEHNIHDLHDGNVGFSTIDGRPVLIDWAGWRN